MAPNQAIWSNGAPSRLAHESAVFEQPWVESGSLPEVLYQLETALPSVTPFVEYGWLAQMLDDLRECRIDLESHLGWEESLDSYLADIDLIGPGQVRQGAKLYREHADLLAQARFLLLMVEKGIEDNTVSFRPIRRRVRELVDALRRHQSQEIELLLDSLCTDLGTGD
jgi:hypothetical protein